MCQPRQMEMEPCVRLSPCNLSFGSFQLELEDSDGLFSLMSRGHLANMAVYEGIYVFHPTIPGYPKARFPGVVVFSEIYQGSLLFSPPNFQCPNLYSDWTCFTVC